MLRVSGATIGLSHRAARDSSLPVTLGFGLQSAEPRDQRVVEEGLYPCGVRIDGVSGEGLGGGYVDTLGGGFETPLVVPVMPCASPPHRVREWSSIS
jgi:hypothetical protein